MQISDILEDKKNQLLANGDPISVTFDAVDINSLSDVTKLRLFKLKATMPADFTPSKDMFDCARRIIEGDSIYRVLEFCMLRNRVLVYYVTSVFSQLRRNK